MKKHNERETSTDVEERAESKAKAPTEPWDADEAENSARKHGILGLPKGKKGHQLRWVREDSIDRRKNQGYVLAKPEDFDATPDENGMIRRNELVLMVVPNEVYDARRQDIAKTTAAQSAGPRREFLREREAASQASGHNMADRDEA